MLGTFGGINIPTVTIFMDGFQAGMDHCNAEKGAAVELEGWDSANPGRSLHWSTSRTRQWASQVAQDLLGEGADIIMPVAGPVGLGSAEAIRDAGERSLSGSTPTVASAPRTSVTSS